MAQALGNIEFKKLVQKSFFSVERQSEAHFMLTCQFWPVLTLVTHLFQHLNQC